MATTGTQIIVTPQIAAEHGLTPEEYARIQKILGRDPNITELGIFSLMWSEHCSYKSSRVHLRRLPTRGARVVQGPGENAGVVDIGDGLCAVFKIESHNHPSFVEPFQGAATGVGGILRDIFTMGARPIAVLDSLRFGPITPGHSSFDGMSSGRLSSGHDFSRAEQPANSHRLQPLRDSLERGNLPSGAKAPFERELSAARLKPCPDEEIARNRRILDGVVRGIAFYGNCFGVPTVAGEVQFEPCYSNNPLVNALALGIARREELFFARAKGASNPVIYAGAKTGRDGIHGASLLASAEFSEESQQKRPNVQVGDPFMEKLLLEACLEAMRTGAVVAIQDMGAAGLTSSSSEMASRGGTGIEIELAHVPQRETGMTPYEIMLSESQERMLLVADLGREHEVFDVFSKWGLDAVEIGKVTDDGKLRILNHGQVAAEIPAHALAEEGPRYSRPVAGPPEPACTERSERVLLEFAGAGADLTENFRRLLASPAIASKYWITEQYDSMVRTNTRLGPGAGDAAVLRLKESKRALAIKTDGNGRWCQLAPRLGAMHAVAEAARNVACTGARPIAATNCLNFGNPEKPEVMWQFSEAIDGIAEACKALEIPITGGNVSFYNETLGKAIYPTPILGVLGLLEDAEYAVGSAFQNSGDAIVLLDGGSGLCSGDLLPRQGRGQAGAFSSDFESFSSSEYAKINHGIVAGQPPAIDLAAEKRLMACLAGLAGERAIHSAHDVSDGGLAVTLAESCFLSDALSAEIKLDMSGPRQGTACSPEQGRGAAAPKGDDFRQGTASAVPNSAEPSGVLTPEARSSPAEIALFGERGARAVVSLSPALLARVQAIAAQYEVSTQHIGTVTRGEFRIQLNGTNVIRGSADSFRRAWSESLAHNIESAS
ncbi:MAG TPA: phosphoribosylformylglycinamidine synthase subunit PurL [Candidatus Sulfotelmatobacter sp.]|nr:phosphoribosylformylglycinamidine synthase subunit PurL [Candidatus Sulfotelmatobacter sp.]